MNKLFAIGSHLVRSIAKRIDTRQQPKVQSSRTRHHQDTV